MYQVSGSYVPAAERGLRWDDPDLGLAWPLPVTVISNKDASWPLLSERDARDLAGTAELVGGRL
jgi:dTDP-4-dehydrorhamnose 3,5-epimerase